MKQISQNRFAGLSLACFLLLSSAGQASPPQLARNRLSADGYIREWTRWTRDVDFSQGLSWQVVGPRSGTETKEVIGFVDLDISRSGSKEPCPWTSEFASIYDHSISAMVTLPVTLTEVQVATITKHYKSDSGAESWYTLPQGNTFYRFAIKDHNPYLLAMIGGH